MKRTDSRARYGDSARYPAQGGGRGGGWLWHVTGESEKERERNPKKKDVGISISMYSVATPRHTVYYRATASQQIRFPFSCARWLRITPHCAHERIHAQWFVRSFLSTKRFFGRRLRAAPLREWRIKYVNGGRWWWRRRRSTAYTEGKGECR